ncbi:hypothetical protein CIL05_11155 [Virgibacillus profundi]|uniref:VWFA domain-containing protein n=1 Tax=Virgibacillus profundi TaxID=2024555 RepID=A0A2A2ICR0_9BACI|nr:VWA domain-containing protein [Virgibacillus profundi]PAV29417.1 hypothetical protein CIL05_11155 [Virgibacillus profundi]PXY53587.1 VWA domain-containing protein [Virgibacillus profundi]
MHFLTPAYFGLSIFLIGVILFYLFRKQYDKQVVPSTFFWQQVMREWQATKWWRKLQQHLLLYLQLLILALLMLALVRPYIGLNDLSGDHIAVVIDTSASMTAKEGEQERLALAMEEIDILIDQLDNQKLTVIIAEQTPEILFSNETSKSKMRNSLEKVESSFRRTNMDEAVQLANQLLSSASGEIHVFSDRVDREQISETHLNHTVAVHNIGTSKSNFSIHTFGVAEQEGKVNGILSVANEMDIEQQFSIIIESAGEELMRIDESIEPGKLTQIQLRDLEKKPYYKAIITNEDDYQADNSSFAFLATDKQPSLYLVGEVNSFITKAFSYLSTDIVQVEDSNEIPQVENAIYILGKVPAENWPDGPLLILSPTTGGPFKIEEKQMLQDDLQAVNEDPLLQFVNIDEVYIQQSYPFDSLTLQSIVTSGETPVISKGSYQGHPLVLLGFDMEETDWPMHSSFPVFLYNTINYLTDQNHLLGYLQPGERKEISHLTGVTNSMILNEDNEQISELNINESFMNAPKKPGLYRVQEETEYGMKERLFAVTVDDEEKYMSPSNDFTIENQSEQKDDVHEEKPNEIWIGFATLALLFLLLEWEVYRRGITG